MTKTREQKLREATEGLTPEALQELIAYADRLLAAQESGEPTELSEMYHVQQQELRRRAGA